MFIQTEATPNPATLKFLPGRDVMGEGAVADFPSIEQAGRSPLAKALFAIPEVSRVFFGSDFISVTKRDGDWKHLKPDGVLAMHVSNHYLDLAPVIALGNRGLGKEIWGVISTDQEKDDVEPYNATYVLLSSRPDFFTSAAFDQRLSVIGEIPKLKMWTDEYTTLWPIFHIKGDL